MMFRVLVIGCGRIATGISKFDPSSHGAVFKKNKDTKIFGCFDVNKKNSENFANMYNCKTYKNLKLAIHETKPDIISLCTPDETHFEILKVILTSDFEVRVILVEKPICTNKNQFKEIEKLTKHKKTNIFVNHTRRFALQFLNIKKQIQKNFFGEIKYINAFYYNGWLHNGVHIIDTILFLFNEKIVIDKTIENIKSSYKSDKTFDVQAKFSNSKCIINIVGFNEKYYQIMEWDFLFTKGRLRITDFGNKIDFETVKENCKGEKELKFKNNFLIKNNNYPLQNIIDKIVIGLKNNNFESLSAINLKNAKSTMDVLWQGVKKYEN